MQIVPLTRAHLDQIEAQGNQEYVSSWMTPAIKEQLEQSLAFAAVEGDQVLGCGGMVEYWEGRAAAWAILSGKCGKQFMAIHRAVKKFFELHQPNRLEAVTDATFGPGHRWLQMLGFTLETEQMPGYLPNGNAAAMYVRTSQP